MEAVGLKMEAIRISQTCRDVGMLKRNELMPYSSRYEGTGNRSLRRSEEIHVLKGSRLMK